MVTEPLTPAPVAEQELVIWVAVNTSAPDVFTFETEVVAPAAPLGPREPEVPTLIWPELNIRAGPAVALPVATVAFCGLFDASAARVTVGVGPVTYGTKAVTLTKYP